MPEADPTPSVTGAENATEQVTGKVGKEGPQAEYTAATTVSSVGELQTKAPEFFKAMQEGIALRIISDQRKHNKRMKELNRKGREQ